jgi:hypothetical protein
MENKSLEERLRLHAYHLWEADGRPHGRSEEYWQKALKLLERETSAGGSSDAPAKKTSRSKPKAAPSNADDADALKAKPKATSKPAVKKAAKPKSSGEASAKPAKKAAAKSDAAADAKASKKPAKKLAVKVAEPVAKTVAKTTKVAAKAPKK